jgi:hypothetical protein
LCSDCGTVSTRKRVPEVEQAAKARLSSVSNSIRLLNSLSRERDELGITTLANRPNGE